MEEEIMLYACNSTEHQFVFLKDSDKKCIYVHTFLNNGSFWSRLKAGLKYIFGYKCRYGHFDEFILSEKHSEKLIEMGNFLK